MRESDAFSWYLEGDPVLRSNVVAALWLESAPDWDYLVARLDRASAGVPAFRQRLLELPGRLAVPRWTGDPEFDLGWHLRRVAAPPPRDDSVVLDVARADAMTGFDPVRPLWRFTLIEGMEGGRAALVMKMHHSLTDGVGAMDLAFRLFDTGPVPPALEGSPEPPAGERIGALRVVTEHAGLRLAQGAGLAGRVARRAIPSAAGALRRPWKAARSAAELTASVGRTVAPLFDTMSPVMRARGLGRHLSVVEVDLDDLQAASRAAGGTVNDGYVAAAAGGLRMYHERHGAPVPELRLMMPINLRSPGDPPGGNRITLMRLEVPVGERDVAARIAEIGRRSRAARHERSLPHTNAIAGGLNLLPPSMVGSIFKHVDFLASNVPGFQDPIYLAGSRVEQEVAFGPTTGTAVNLTLISYCGRCTVGVTVDTSAVPDPDVLVQCIHDGFGEVLALAPERKDSGRR